MKTLDTVECCATCKRYYPIKKFDYTNGGCVHTDMEGFACMIETVPIYSSNPGVIWMVGVDPSKGMCEGYQKRKE